jgi:DNA-binding NarL/FixJ family response regulator
MTIRVLIADDQELMRSALRMSLSPEPDIDVVGVATDGREAVAQAGKLRPDVVLMDIRMPHLDGVEATSRIVDPLAERPVRVLVITGFDVDAHLVHALRAGASGFLVKDATADEVVQAVRVIARGDAILAPSVTRRLLDGYVRFLQPAEPPSDVTAGLTPRELGVLRLVACGCSNAEIAGTLHIAVSSVKTHLSHVLAKLGLADRVHLVIFAYEHGLVHPNGPGD